MGHHFIQIRTLLCVAALLGLVGCKQSSATRRTEQFIPVVKGTRVEVSLSTGYISVSAGRTGMVSLKVFRKVRAVWSAESKLKDIKVLATKKKGLLRIVGKAPSSTGSKKYHMHLHITVPPDTALVLATKNGHINLSNVLGDVKATTRRGELRARGVTGRLTLQTGEGNITVRGAPQQFQLKTKLGDVQIWLRPETKLSGKCSGRTESGALTLHASTKLKATVTAQSKGGELKSAFPTDSKKQGRLKARLGRGGPAVSLYCHKGELALKKW